MIKKIRDWVLKLLIKRAMKRKICGDKSISLQRSKKIGILAFLDREEDFHRVVTFKKSLEAEGKKVMALGFFPRKNVPDFYLVQSQIDVFTKRDVNFFGVPKGAFVRSFINEKFDILIDVSIEESSALAYIAGVSAAGIKVGKYRKKMLYVYDLLIKHPHDMPFDEYVSTLKSYLLLLNTSEK
jgi:hypothetical protein